MYPIVNFIENSTLGSAFLLLLSFIATYVICLIGEVNIRYRMFFTLIVSSTFLAVQKSQGLCFHRIPILRTRAFRLILIPAFIATLFFVPYLVIAHKFPDIGFRFPLRVAQGVPPIVMSGPSISVIIPYQNEVPGFLEKTVLSIYTETREDLLKEIIVVDDGSSEPLTTIPEFPKMKILRNEEPQGLTRAKIRGADFATGSHILFLDAHCKVGPNWAEWLLGRSAQVSYKDIIIPQIVPVNPKTFKFEQVSGYSKLIFQWNFEFVWIFTDTGEAPVLPGGIELMTRKRWLEAKYDQGMRQWGGENIEQSLMTWMCGGKILTEERAIIGHVFDRPNPTVVREISVVVENQARGAFVWLDEWLKFFKARHFEGSKILSGGKMNLEGIDKRLELRHRLQCNDFNSYVEKFDKIFDERGLLIEKETAIMHVKSGLCLTVSQLSGEGKMHERPVKLVWDTCRPYETGQRFTPVRGDVLLRSVAYERCLERRGNEVVLHPCGFLKVSVDQIFSFLPENWLGQPVMEGDLRRERTCLAGPMGTEEGVKLPVTMAPCSTDYETQINVRPIFSGV